MIACTLAKRTASISVPPSVQGELIAALETASLWVSKKASESDVAGARAACFQAVSAIEDATVLAVKKAQAHLEQSAQTPLDPHADHVVERYARLAAHFTVSAVCHTLDAITSPEAALEVLGDVEGARAYQKTGLGSARHAAFRKAAWNQAEWEASRRDTAGAEALAVQVFHEYLGGRWRTHADAQRAESSAFLDWALRGR
jgi:hypothetical protein